ncbi:kinase-like protein [Dothidotthia symphoricarpi CBS 119687]|uniref:Kinase-like protein n=1 Tax=Dothidotthia symphoricarpi CBS 119687 TaxID=1392245 RepID=A0A6A6AAA3_9PLEO|nr:kinase-like protein [Dothidotthia symphoricarpi CBS 119687]KAF2127611.1 kinase-like protein [Dothidotthia symphoricarpi CBS 119687]
MHQSTNSPWGKPAVDYPKPQYSLSHTVSMVNLHEEAAWYANRGPTSPTASSASSTSRTTTPTTINNNPWSNIVASPDSNSTTSTQSAGSSPRDSPNRTPEHVSRSTTPVAPQPIRPYNVVAGFAPLSPALSSSGDSYKSFEYPGPLMSAFPGSPNPYRQPVVPLTPLVNGFINTSVLSSQGQSLSGWFYELCRKQGWDGGLVKKIWQWTLSNPRVAILLFVCDDVSSWRQAAFFDLRDESLPFPEDRLQGIVADARKLVSEQWRATSKELPLTGGHVDFAVRETVPLQHVGLIRTSRNSEKSVDKVRVLGSNDDRILVRKRFITTRPSQKAAVLEQIKKFQQYEHKNIAKILCSYAQPSHIGIATDTAQYSLDEYLALPGHDSSRSKVLVDWMHDLASALEYLHSQSICHRGIRPRKILIDGPRIFFAPFEIGHSSDNFSPTIATSQRLDQLQTYFQDQAYIYAAPEAIVSRGKRMADVFSLGCVLLSMMTVAQNQSVASFAQYRAGSSQDASFHAHLDRVASWRNRLHAASTSGLRNGNIGSGRRMRQLKAEAEWLSIIEKMLLPRPKERIKMSHMLASLGGAGKVAGARRRSLDGGGYAGQVAVSMGANTSTTTTAALIDIGPERIADSMRKPELSVFDGYFQQQSRRLEPAGGW